MALRKILTVEEPALHKKCRPVSRFDEKLYTLLGDMTETLHEADGVGLAAPQVGILRRIVVVDTGESTLELINPEILETDGEQDGLEGCLSLPGKYGMVKRPNHVRIKAQNRQGEWFEAEAEGLIARAFCHECDHLDGRVYTELAYHMLSDKELEEMRTDAEEDQTETEQP
jgi:peptide deformylase